MSFDLSSKKISKTFQHLLQQRGDDNKLYDLQGNEIGDLRISGSLIAQTYTVSSSVTNMVIATNSGSTEFGNDSTDNHRFTGSILVNGNISGSSTSTGSFGNVHIYERLGIGTSLPSNTLSVKGTISASSNVRTAYFLASDAGNSQKPSFAFISDSTLGIYKIAEDRLGFSANAIHQLEITENKISGSATSTGSFGNVFIDGEAGIKGDVAIGVPQAAETLQGSYPINSSHGDNFLSIVAAGDTNQKPVLEFIASATGTDAQAGKIIFGNRSAGTKNIAEIYALVSSGDISKGRIFFETGNTTALELGESQNATFYGNISSSATSTGSFGRVEAMTISASIVDVDASTLRIGGVALNKTLIDNVKESFSSTTAATVGKHKLRGDISGSSTSTGSFGKLEIGDNTDISGKLSLPGFTNVSSSLAAAVAGGDDLGGHTATQTLDMDGNTIDKVGRINPSADNTKDLGSTSLRFRTLYSAETQIGGVFETGLRTKGIDKFETGIIVVWSKDGLEPCVKAYDNLVMGVIKKGRDVPIVLGAEPVLLTGRIKLGDYIVTSKKIGHGMAISEKMFFNKNLFGKVIGQALEDAEGESVLVKCMIRKM